MLATRTRACTHVWPGHHWTKTLPLLCSLCWVSKHVTDIMPAWPKDPSTTIMYDTSQHGSICRSQMPRGHYVHKAEKDDIDEHPHTSSDQSLIIIKMPDYWLKPLQHYLDDALYNINSLLDIMWLCFKVFSLVLLTPENGVPLCVTKAILSCRFLDVPDAPENLVLSEHKERSVKLKWIPGEDHNSSTTGNKAIHLPLQTPQTAWTQAVAAQCNTPGTKTEFKMLILVTVCSYRNVVLHSIC